MNISLINEYKIPFIVNRIFQTFFGGFELNNNLSKISPQPKVNGLSSNTSSLLRIFMYLFPASVGILSSLLIDHNLIDSYIGILITSLVGFFFTMIMNIMPQISAPGSNKTSPLWSPNLVVKEQNLFPMVIKYHSTVLILARSLISSSLIGMMTNSFKLKQIKLYMQTGNLLTLCILILVWFTFTTVHYSLIVGSPPETTAYSIRFHQFDCFNRPIYLLSLLVPITLIQSSTYPICTLVICSLPFMWLLGILPPIMALVHYLLERINIVLLAGTANCFIWSLSATVLSSLIIILLSHFYLDSNQFVLVNLLSAFLISNKWMFNLSQLHRWTYLLKMNGSIMSIILINSFPIDSTRIRIEILKLLLIILTIIYVAKYLNLIYIFNIVKNPLNMIMSLKFMNIIEDPSILILILRIMIHFMIPITCLAFMVNQLSVKRIQTRTGQLTAQDFFLNLLVFRIFRQCWQHPQSMSFQIILLQIIYDARLMNRMINEWPLEIKYFILDLIFIFTMEFFKKLYAFLTILLSSVMMRKQKVKYSWTIFVINIIMLPVNLAIIIISSILNVPILPLFTLPLFMLSFPRPLKFWSTTPITPITDVNDAVYYKQIMPRLINSLYRKSLFWDFRNAGEILIARFDDRLMWFQVLESGHNYVQIQMKGLELQETSCHTIEASNIDQIIEHSFHSSGLACTNIVNKHPFHCFNPLMKVSTKTYSDAKSVLSGIIDSPETFCKIKKIFCQVFIWILLQTKINLVIEQRKRNNEDASAMVKDSQINIVIHSHKESVEGSSDCMFQDPVEQFGYDDLKPELQWSKVTYKYARRKSINQLGNQNLYSAEWFQELLKHFTVNEENFNENELKSLILAYNHITNVCFMALFSVARHEASTAQVIYELFNGRITKDVAEEKFFFMNPDLHKVSVKGFQYSTKIIFDQLIFSEEFTTHEELIAKLKEFDENWLFGQANSAEWKEGIVQEKSYLFSISKDSAKETYQSHLLTLKDTEVYIGSLNRSVIEAIWCTLSFELLYLTNDDEERYSIQAHQIIFRNLTVQAADPPLGYPAYISEPVLINHL